jgi:hypothetical protein
MTLLGTKLDFRLDFPLFPRILMPSAMIEKWLSQWDAGQRTRQELFGLMYERVTFFPEEIPSVLAALRGHGDPDIQSLANELAAFLQNKGNH